MRIPPGSCDATRQSRYHQAFGEYERRCPRRDELIHAAVAELLTLSPMSAVDLLDVGVGNGASGVLASHLGRGQLRVTAVDIDPVFFPRAATRLSECGVTDMRFVECDMRDSDALALFKSQFDIVLASNVLYRYADDSGLFRTLLACCRPSGAMVVVHATATAPWTRVLADAGSWSASCHGSEAVFGTLRRLGLTFRHSTVRYPVNVGDVLDASQLTSSQADFLLWLLPRSTLLTAEVAARLVALLSRLSDARGNVWDERDVIAVSPRE